MRHDHRRVAHIERASLATEHVELDRGVDQFAGKHMATRPAVAGDGVEVDARR